MKTLLFAMLILACTCTQAQNTNLGTNAGNGGSLNTSIGYFAGDGVNGTGNIFLGHFAGRYVSVGNQNSFVGSFSGNSTTNGSWNSFFGTYAGASNTTGNENTFVGFQSGHTTGTGQQNSFFGTKAGKQNTTASNNSYFGYSSGYTNSTGIKNAFFGSESGFYNTASYNTLIGYRAGYSNTTGNANTYLGSESGYFNTTGSGNSFIGYSSGKNNSSGYNNTFMGSQSGLANTSAANNTFIGNFSGSQTTTGASNSLLGSYSGSNLTTGQNNVFIGMQAGINNNGSNNVFIGLASGGQNTGSGNVFIGNESGFYSDKNSNKLIINNNGDSSTPLIYGDFQNRQLGIGTSSLGSYALSVNGDAFASGLWLSSDKRFKQNEKTISGALEKLDHVKGVSYQFKKSESTNERNFSEGTQLGFMAQDLQKIFPELVKENSDGYLAVNYSGMIPVLVEAIKELKTEINTLKTQLSDKSNEIKNHDLRNEAADASLEQNHPNPFGNETTIGYTLPDGSSAAIYIFDLTGKQVSVFNNLKAGKNEIVISSAQLPAGLYNYSLVVNGVILDSKKMLLSN